METPQELDIKQYLRLLYQKRYVFVSVMVIITSIAAALSFMLPKTYEAQSTVLIEGNFLNLLMKDITVTPSLDDRLKTLEVTLKSRALILKVMRGLDLGAAIKSDSDRERLLLKFQKQTSVKIEMNKATRGGLDMFVVSFKHANPIIARDYVNALVGRYVEESLSMNRDASYGANSFLQEQINLFKGKIEVIETEIARLNKDKKVDAQGRLTVLQKQMDELLAKYTEDYPDVVKLKSEIVSLKSRLSAGSASNGRAERTLENEPETSSVKQSNLQKIIALERDRDAYRKIYEQLLATMGRSEVSSQIEMQDKGGAFKILEPAVLPDSPVSMNPVQIILLGLVAGIVGGIGFIILLDSMDKSVKTVEGLKTFGYPVLAVIPRVQDPAVVQKAKKNDQALYAFSGVYLACIVGLLLIALLRRG